MTGLGWASAYQVAAAIRCRDVSAAEVLEDQLDRIQRHDARLRSVVTIDADGARRRAAEADQALARGQVWGPLHGVGVTVEDVHATAGMRSTFGGYRPFAEHVPAADATVVARLKAAGAIIVGKTNRSVRDAPDRAPGTGDRHAVHPPDPQVPRADHGWADRPLSG